MRLWLLGIMACPIDKTFPLEVEIFKWDGEISGADETLSKKDQIEKDHIGELIENYNKKKDIFLEEENPISYEIDDSNENRMMIRDELIIKPSSLLNYLKTHIDKINEINIDSHWLIKDSSSWSGNHALELCNGIIKQNIIKKISSLEKLDEINKELEQELDIVKELQLELHFLNKFMYHFNIEIGVIRCPECNRWFPITETIPQMLPDNLRNKERDNNFKKQYL